MQTIQSNSIQTDFSPLRVGDLAENRQPDTELLALFLETGNRSALEPIVVRYSGLVYSVVSKVVYQSQDREDACQATFLSLIRSASRIRNQQSLASWLCSAAFRIAIRLRQNHRTSPGSLSLADLEMLAEQSPDPLSQVAQDIEFEKLNVELQKLPTELRAVLVEHYFLGLSAPAIAERMELSVSAVEGRLRRGKQRLRSALARMGIGLSVVTGAVASMEKTATATSGRLCELCLSALQCPTSSVASASSIGLSGSGGSVQSALTQEINARVLTLVHGEMTMSTIGITKVAYGTGLAACALLATSLASNLLLSNHQSGAGRVLAISSSYANGLEVDEAANASFAVSQGVGSAGGNGSGDGGGAGTGAQPTQSGTGADGIGSGPQSSNQAWKTRGEVATKRIEKARSTLELEMVDVAKLETTQELFGRLADIAQMPVVISPEVESDVSAIQLRSCIDSKLQLGKDTKLSARDILELALAECKTAGYVIRSNRIEIVPIIDANAVRMYDVSSIVPAPSDIHQQNLLKLVSDFVLRDKDIIQGGSAKVSIAGNTLIVWCDEPTHREIEEFLGQVSKLEGGVGVLTNHPEPPQSGGMGGGMM